MLDFFVFLLSIMFLRFKLAIACGLDSSLFFGSNFMKAYHVTHPLRAHNSVSFTKFYHNSSFYQVLHPSLQISFKTLLLAS